MMTDNSLRAEWHLMGSSQWKRSLPNKVTFEKGNNILQFGIVKEVQLKVIPAPSKHKAISSEDVLIASWACWEDAT